MIKCEGGKVELEEDANKLLSELTAICRGLRVFLVKEGYSKETGDKLIRKAVDVGFWTEDKLDKELSNMRAEVLGKLMGLALSLIWGGTKDE